VCRDLVREIGQLDPQLFEQYGLKLNVIGCGKASGIPSFAQDTGFDATKIFVDFDRRVYQRLNLVVAKSMSGLSDSTKKKNVKTGLCSGLCWSLCKTVSRGSQGDVMQMGGTFISNQAGQILFQHYDEYSNDSLQPNEYADVLQRLFAQGTAKVPDLGSQEQLVAKKTDE
jgi:hypothetical protein